MTENKYSSNLQEINLKDKIIGWKCQECDQEITAEHYRDGNYTLWFSADNYNWETLGDKAKLTLSIQAISHERQWGSSGNMWNDCPDTEICSGCDKKFTDDKLRNGLYEKECDQDEKTYWCEPCFKEKYGEYLKARSKKKEMKPEQKEVMKIVQKALTEHLKSNYHHGRVDYSSCKGSECEGYKETLESYGYDREK